MVTPALFLAVAAPAAAASPPSQQQAGAPPACAFPTSLNGTECWGLSSKTTDKMGHPLTTAAQCQAACCAEATCSVWNWNTAETTKIARCWVMQKPGGQPSHCGKPAAGSQWVGGQGRPGQPPAPPPPPPPPPGTPKALKIVPGRAPAPLPYTPTPAHCVDPAGNKFGADSLSMLRSDAASSDPALLRRWFPMSGGIHLGRVPAAAWREELLKMKAGGLNMVNVYVFWIHHEESRGNFDFTGRRDIRKFILLVQELGLHVLMRIGPWDVRQEHGYLFLLFVSIFLVLMKDFEFVFNQGRPRTELGKLKELILVFLSTANAAMVGTPTGSCLQRAQSPAASCARATRPTSAASQAGTPRWQSK
jgi:hypothetical protein